MKALISPEENNRILEIKKDLEVFSVALPFYWIDCSEEITSDWQYNGITFIAPEDPKKIIKKQAYDLVIEDIKDRLKESDWTQLPDVSTYYGKEVTKSWINYRNKLRTLLENPLLDPINIDLPSPPYDNM
jgi:hypothetical protein